MKKAVLFVPFWRRPGHIGNVRIDRFIRWLRRDGFRVIVVRAGPETGTRAEEWGLEVTVRDPLGLYPDPAARAESGGRQPNKRRRALAYWLFNPDPSVVWARSAARNKLVIENTKDAAFVLSSNPPESAHVGAWILAKRVGVPHLVDMRDGWLDEPLKPILRNSWVRRWREGRVERVVLRDADKVFVTSTVWKELLVERMGGLESKAVVVTNGYPANNRVRCEGSNRLTNSVGTTHKSRPAAAQPNDLVLVHAGRFTGSDPRRSPRFLLEPLLKGISQSNIGGRVLLLGSISDEDRSEVETFLPEYRLQGWKIEMRGNVPREEALSLLREASGLLLLSVTYAQLPGKLFEYIPTGRPIMAVAEEGSATWNVCRALPQAFLKDYRAPEGEEVNRYILACSDKDFDCAIPKEFSEVHLSQVFLDAVAEVQDAQRERDRVANG